MNIDNLYWDERHFVSDAEDAVEGFFGSVTYIFNTVGDEYGTPVIQTGWECLLIKEGKRFIMWNCSEDAAKKAVEGFISGDLAADMIDQ